VITIDLFDLKSKEDHPKRNKMKRKTNTKKKSQEREEEHQPRLLPNFRSLEDIKTWIKQGEKGKEGRKVRKRENQKNSGNAQFSASSAFLAAHTSLSPLS
jgi:hypothetical protein